MTNCCMYLNLVDVHKSPDNCYVHQSDQGCNAQGVMNPDAPCFAVSFIENAALILPCFPDDEQGLNTAGHAVLTPFHRP